MKHPLLAAAAALLVAVPCLAGGSSDPAVVEATFDSARLADDLQGTLSDPAKEVHIGVHVSAGSKVTAKLTADVVGTMPAGPSLVLCDAAGVDQGVAGSQYDKSVPGSFVVKWKNVPLHATGDYTFVVKNGNAGAWHLTLSGTMATLKTTTLSSVNLGVNAQTQIPFDGLRGGKLSYTLAAAQNSKFVGSLVRVTRPDGTTIAGTPTTASGKVPLDQDGVYQLVFENVGRGIGAWKATTTVSPPPLKVRHGYVTADGTALVPVVSSVTPPRDYQRDNASAVTISGRNFQDGADVRLIRNGFQDIVATNVVVVSETQVQCVLNLDTAPITGIDSLGTWKFGFWNAPVYTVAGDPTTLVKDSPTKSTAKTFECLSSSSISLPRGVMKNTEVWQLVFDSDFQDDLNRMGLGSADGATAVAARGAVEAYVVCYLRDLFRVNETNGNLSKNTSPPVSFVIGTLPNPAGKPGVDYNRLEVGGAWQSGDERDPADVLFWGFAPLDTGNTHRDDLSVNADDGKGGTVRLGWGARTRVLDPTASNAAATWVAATAPLRQIPLTSADLVYFQGGFAPISQADANRYRDVVMLVSRAAREIAAICAHHIGRAMGLPSAGAGPMASPDTAGNMSPVNGSLAFLESDVATLRAVAVPGTLPGTSKPLVVTYFPFISTQPSYLPNCTTAVAYSVDWNYVGGRANAQVTDYSVQYIYSGSSNPPLDIAVTYQGLSGTARLYIDASQGLFYCNIQRFGVLVTDTVRNNQYAFGYRLNILPNIPLLRPGNEQNQATNCKNTILSTP
jgi:hypothetical protein